MPRFLVLAALVGLLTGCVPAVPSVASAPSTKPAAPVSVPPTSAAASAVASSVASSAAPRVVSRLAGVDRALNAGSYVYEDAFPHVTFEVPTGWHLDQAMPRHFGIRPDDALREDTFDVWFDMHLASKDPSCPELPRAGVGHSASDLESSFHGNPAVVATRSKMEGVGGLMGHIFDLQLAPTWKVPCPFSDGRPTAPLFVDDDIDGEPAFWGISGPERIRMIVLDDQHGSNVLITLDSASGKTLDSLTAAAMPVLQTFQFDVES